jgi:hypothetical protein
MDLNQLKTILKLHKKWTHEAEGGQRGNLSGWDLQGVNFSGADMEKINLSGANLSKAILKGVCLHGADLRGTDFRGADLRKANLRWAELYKADMREADLSYADLRGANMEKAILSGILLDGALFDASIRYEFKSGQKIAFCPYDGTAAVNGVIVGFDDTLLTLGTGGRDLKFSRDKGSIEILPANANIQFQSQEKSIEYGADLSR